MDLVLSGCDAWGRPIQPAAVGAVAAPDPAKTALLFGVAPGVATSGLALLLGASWPVALGYGAFVGVVGYLVIPRMAMSAV